jgi:hypothetical protein
MSDSDEFDFEARQTQDPKPVAIIGDLGAAMMDFLANEEDTVEEVYCAGIAVVAVHASGTKSTLSRTTSRNTQVCLQMWHAAAASELAAQIQVGKMRVEQLESMLRVHGIDPDDDGEG